jgi:hypothetical protein
VKSKEENLRFLSQLRLSSVLCTLIRIVYIFTVHYINMDMHFEGHNLQFTGMTARESLGNHEKESPLNL